MKRIRIPDAQTRQTRQSRQPRAGGSIARARTRRIALILSVLALALTWLVRTETATPVRAEPLDEDLRQLLEKSLTLAELDRELQRIGRLREQTLASLRETRQRLGEREAAIAKQREKAGRVLRAYYMGDKLLIWQALLSARSLSELMRLWEMAELIFRSDKEILLAHAEAYRLLQQERKILEERGRELERVELALQLQRNRLIRLQQEVDEALAARDDAEQVSRLMEELQKHWRTVGLPEVREYFGSLAAAMNDFPAWLDEHPDAVVMKGLRTSVTITDRQMNEFLRSRDPRFEQLEFRFDDGKLSLRGSNGTITLELEGRYTVESEPQNAIRFHVERLVFNGFELPDTTRADLEREFDLALYPRQLFPFVVAESVELEDGKLTLQLRLSL